MKNDAELNKAVNTIFEKLDFPLLSFVWKDVYCPKKQSKIQWDECLSCSDLQKYPMCPILPLRKYMKPAEDRIMLGRYHVTELKDPRQAYFKRISQLTFDFSDQNFLDLYIGTAVHDALQKVYPRSFVEYKVIYPFTYEGDRINVVGKIDVLDIPNKMLIDFKVYLSLKWLLERNQPEPSHVFQVQSYYEILKFIEPEIASKIDKLLIVYISKTRVSDRWKEFYLKPEGNPKLKYLAITLHKALKSGIPPNLCENVIYPSKNKFPCNYCTVYHECEKDWRVRYDRINKRNVQ